MNKYMPHLLVLIPALLLNTMLYANDSTGYVATGGVQYIKNPQIAMQREDLFVSKQQIRVAYDYKNLTSKDIEETILFPMPLVPSTRESDFANTPELLHSFKIWSNGQRIQPKAHVRAFLQPLKANGEINWDGKPIDVTDHFKACGLTDTQMMQPWMQSQNTAQVNRMLHQCNNKVLQALVKPFTSDEEIYWQAQIIYSWQQIFKANAMTQVKHSYSPLLGGSVSLDPATAKQHCVDDSFKKTINKTATTMPPYTGLSYILKTGANWAKPIDLFNLTIERDQDELVSLCWNGKLQRTSPTQFKATERQYVPRQDLNIIFVRIIKN